MQRQPGALRAAVEANERAHHTDTAIGELDHLPDLTASGGMV